MRRVRVKSSFRKPSISKGRVRSGCFVKSHTRRIK